MAETAAESFIGPVPLLTDELWSDPVHRDEFEAYLNDEGRSLFDKIKDIGALAAIEAAEVNDVNGAVGIFRNVVDRMPEYSDITRILHENRLLYYPELAGQ